MKVFAGTKKEPSIEATSAYLGIPVEVLERTRKTVHGEVSTPEYQQEWFSSTLEKSTEAKKANRDFCQATEDQAASMEELANVVATELSTDSDERSDMARNN
ncbi:hypothetical protein PI124_g573 [Phytophthora idaei]|nr:hypothetical protein PI125_g12363 [Phytophthora idaei]KAG3147750.1 hypothetical protein PI126_g12746 [Phytophthora idaei]KAG3254902.1 hypothetical protein PI124_g573 [Phytophthora idaei]